MVLVATSVEIKLPTTKKDASLSEMRAQGPKEVERGLGAIMWHDRKENQVIIQTSPRRPRETEGRALNHCRPFRSAAFGRCRPAIERVPQEGLRVDVAQMARAEARQLTPTPKDLLQLGKQRSALESHLKTPGIYLR